MQLWFILQTHKSKTTMASITACLRKTFPSTCERVSGVSFVFPLLLQQTYSPTAPVAESGDSDSMPIVAHVYTFLNIKVLFINKEIRKPIFSIVVFYLFYFIYWF